jgi:TFIIF-interacting CTD phosphatase-like protein
MNFISCYRYDIAPGLILYRKFTSLLNTTQASKLFEMHLYTMGNKLYATEMAKVLDPNGVLFAGRVISRGDDPETVDTKCKDLEGVLGLESSVVIIDDSPRVWPHNQLNLITVERYVCHSMKSLKCNSLVFTVISFEWNHYPFIKF